MKTGDNVRQRILILALGIVGIAPVMAADDAGMGKDLAATIALQGLPCDKVVDSKRNGDSDYTATCKDGNRYRVYVEQGRVLVKKQ
jgi:hypothetical protein